MPTMIEEEVLVEEKIDSQLDKMKRLPRGSFKPKKGATDLENCKVKISMYLDADIVQYFRNRAESPASAPYQTQINNELRRIMENYSREVQNIENDILSKETNKIKLVFGKTLELISLYKSNDLSIPFGLKGNLGEFIVQIELLKRFPNSKIDFRGGSFPSVDIVLENIKIQVKTQIKHERRLFKNGYLDFESSPTIKKSILDEKKCDILILVILYPNESFSHIEQTNIYVFDHHDFNFFDTKFCWSGNSKGDYTIVKILNVEGTPPKKLQEIIAHYNTQSYRDLFETSKDNWLKIKQKLWQI